MAIRRISRWTALLVAAFAGIALPALAVAGEIRKTSWGAPQLSGT